MCDKERNINKIMNMDIETFDKWTEKSFDIIDKEFTNIEQDTLLLIKEINKLINESNNKK